MNHQEFALVLLLVCMMVFATLGCSDDGDSSAVDGDLDGSELADSESDGFDDGLPESFDLSFERMDEGQAQNQEELASFTQKLSDFYVDQKYFDWLLRMSHGVDASTGKRDYRLWWTDSHAEKSGDLVTMVHNYSEQHGGHNILKGNSTILSSALGGYLLTGDDVMGELSEQYCKGISQTMLGMVYDENDSVHHLMTRNVITFNHDYTTHDGYSKAVDYSNWFFSYDRWNCSRFNYVNNPYWGEVWVTNTRSKDGLGYLFEVSIPMLYAAKRADDESVREACSESYDLLVLFVQDIVDHGYNIRSKRDDGTPYLPGIDEGPEEADTGDLASFVAWDAIFPDAECQAKLASALMAYGDEQGLQCTPFGGDLTYEKLSIENNAPNAHIMRAFHIASIRWALLNGKNELALRMLQGLEERFERDRTMSLEEVSHTQGRWFRDMAINYIQAAASGYPLTATEVDEVQGFISRAVDQYAQFPNWNLWDAALDDGEYDWIPATSETDAKTVEQYWLGSDSLGLVLEYCWSPFKNPAGQPLVDCELLLESMK